jgi:hypothetical protein
MALAIVQSHAAIHGANVPGSSSQVTLSGAPTSGNLLICFLGVNIGKSSITVNTADWTPFEAVFQEGRDTNLTMMALYRYVEPGDVAALPAMWTAGSTYWTHMVWEISGVTGDWEQDLLFTTGVRFWSANAAYPALPIPTDGCLALTGTASYNGGSNPSYSGSWSLDQAFNNNSNYGSCSGAHRFVDEGDVLDGAPTQGTSQPYGMIYLILCETRPTTIYPRRFYTLSGGSGYHPRDLETYNTPKQGNLLVAFMNYGAGDAAGIVEGADWTEFAAIGDGTPGEVQTLAIYRYVEPGDTSVLPELTTSGSTGAFSSHVVIELDGVTGVWADDHQGADRKFWQGSGTSAFDTTADTTTGDNQIALLNFANYNASDLSTVSGTGWVYLGANNVRGADYGGWFVAINFFPTGGANVTANIDPGNGNSGSAYIQSLFAGGGGGPPPGPSSGAEKRTFPAAVNARTFPLDTSRTFPRA